MSLKVASTFELDGIEKFLCVHGSWETICHAAHLTGDRMQLMHNALPAIACLLKRHPRMRTRLRIENSHYFLDNIEYSQEHLPSSIFFSTIDSCQDSWESIAEKRCNQNPFSEDGLSIFPLFHFVLLFDSSSSSGTFHLLVFENHCAADGRSGFILVNDFLTLATSSDLNPDAEPLNNNILPLINDMIPPPYGSFYPIVSYIGKKLFKHQAQKLNTLRIPVKLIPLSNGQLNRFQVPQYYTKFLFSSSSPDLYANLHEQCRLHEVTLNGPLLACLTMTVHHCYPLRDQRRLKPFPIGMAFDMRSRIPGSPLSKTSVGAFIGFSDVKLNRSLSMRSTRFWSLAKNCMVSTRNQLKPTGVPLVAHVLADSVRNERFFNELVQRFPDGRHSELALSNIGKYPFSCEYAQGNIRLHGLHVINNNSVYRASAVVFVTCVGDGQLDISLAHEMESDEQAQQFLTCYTKLIQICANDKLCHAGATLSDILKCVQQ